MEPNDFTSDDSVFNLLAASSGPSTTMTVHKKQMKAKEMHSFANLIAQQHDDIESDVEEEVQKPTNHVPVDWSLKLKLRILSNIPISGSRLKSNEEASGITGFVSILIYAFSIYLQ